MNEMTHALTGIDLRTEAERADSLSTEAFDIPDHPGDGQHDSRETASVWIPGLVNMHDHLRTFMPAHRLSEGAALSQVITAAAETQAAATAADYGALTALAAARNLLAGTTTVVDHVYPVTRDDVLQAVIDAHARVGIRAKIALGILTRGHSGTVTTVEESIRLADRAVDSKISREDLFLAPVSLRQNRPGDYRTAARAAERLGVRLYTHIAETAAEVDQCRAEHGLTPVEFLYESGFLQPGTVLAHAIHLSERDIELLRATESAVAYCPTNHLKFAKGFAPVAELLDAGVRVTLGVDGMESMFHEMRHAIFAQGQANSNPGVLSSETAFEMATSSARTVLGSEYEDSVRLDFSTPGMQPVADAMWTTVHRAGPAQVTTVVLNGEAVVHDGELTRVDPLELAQDAVQATRRLAERTHRPAALQDIPMKTTKRDS